MAVAETRSKMPASPSEPSSERPPIAGARRYGTQLITSGQTAHTNGINVSTGVVGDTIDLTTARECAWVCAKNVVDAAEAEIGDLSRISSITRVTIYVAATPDFMDHHLVGDAATRRLNTFSTPSDRP